MNNSAIILLSGGLDSFVSLDMAKEKYDIKLSLTFDYGQKAFNEEKEASQKISKYYNIENKIVELPFLKEILDNSLTNKDKNNFDDFSEIYIPNRNGLFLNIAAVYCEKIGAKYIIFVANKEEAKVFSDNSSEFVQLADKFFNYSTQINPKIVAPCIEFDKIQIINYAINKNMPFSYLKSCYDSKNYTNKKHCGECMSCKLLKQAILKSNKKELIQEVFK